MEIGEWAGLLTLFITPIVYGLIYFNRQKLWNWYRKGAKDPTRVQVVQEVAKLWKIRLGKIRYTVFLPIFIILLDALIRVKKFESPGTPVWQQIISIFLQPFTEEILFRAAIFGTVTFMILYSLKIKPGLIQTEIILTALFIQAIAFGLAHPGNVAPRILMGLLYGALYVVTDLKDTYKKRSLNFDKTNLLPPTIAHSTTNLLVSLFS